MVFLRYSLETPDGLVTATGDTSSITVDESDRVFRIYVSAADVASGKLPYVPLCDTLLELYNITGDDREKKWRCMMMILTTDDNKVLDEILEREGLVVDALCVHMDGAEDAHASGRPADLQHSSKMHHQDNARRPPSVVKDDFAMALSRIAGLCKGFDLTAIAMHGSSVEGLEGKGTVLGNERTGGSPIVLNEPFSRIRISDQRSSQHNVNAFNGGNGDSDRSFASFYQGRTGRDTKSFPSPQVQQWQQDIGAKGEYFVSTS